MLKQGIKTINTEFIQTQELYQLYADLMQPRCSDFFSLGQ